VGGDELLIGPRVAVEYQDVTAAVRNARPRIPFDAARVDPTKAADCPEQVADEFLERASVTLECPNQVLIFDAHGSQPGGGVDGRVRFKASALP
jgi:hypothetical protein